MPTGLGDEQLWLSATNDNTGTSTAFNDQSGEGNNGTASGTLVVADTSEGGSYAFDFDAAGEIIEVSGLIGTTIGSVSMWVKRSALQNTTMWFEGTNWFSSTGWDEAFYSYAGTDYARCGNAQTGLATNLPSSGDWFHLAVLSNSGSSDIYVNGVFQESVTTAAAIALATSLKFGCCSGSTVSSSILQDDIRVFDRVLAQAEITHLASQRGIEGPAPVGLGDEQLWWCPTHSQSLLADSSPQGHSVAKVATVPTLVADTDEGGAYAGQFTTSGCVRVQDGFGFLSTGDCSTSGWVKQVSTDRLIFSFQQAGGLDSDKSGIAVDNNNGELRARFRSGTSDSNDIMSAGSSTVPNNTWYHVTATREGSTCKIFLDGTLVATKTISGYPSNPDLKDLLIGGLWSGGSVLSLSTGYMDDIRVYDRVLAQSEITHLASQRGIEGPAPVGLGDEQLWLCPSLNDSASDISGNGNDGTYNGGMGTVADTGEGGSLAFDFDGTDDYIDCGNTLGGSVGGNDSAVTYSSWMKFDSYSNNNNGYGTAWMGKCDNVSDGGWLLNSTNGKIDLARFPFLSNGGPSLVSTTDVSQVPLSTWKHVAATYSGCETTGCTSIYIDGVAVSITESESSYGTMPVNAETFKIGATLTGMAFKRMMNGLLDDIRVFNRVLTQAEITHLATSRGIEGSPSTTTQYNAFITHAFKQLFQARLR